MAGARHAGSVVAPDFCPLAGRTASSDDDYFEALSGAVFAARFSVAVVQARWPAIRRAFAGFALRQVAAWGDDALPRLLAAPGILRSPKKIVATLRNARDLTARIERWGSAAAYLDAFAPDVERLVAELDEWVHYAGAPSIRVFLRCVGIPESWREAPAHPR